MNRLLAASLVAAVLLLVPLPSQAAWGQSRITSSQLEELKAKVELTSSAYLRLDLAEKEALAEGAQDRAKIFSEAKAKAYQEYVTLNAQLHKAQMDKREQDLKDNAQAPDRR